MTVTEPELKTGRVVGIAGPVVDVEFPPGHLPEINAQLQFSGDLGSWLDGAPEMMREIESSASEPPAPGLSRKTLILLDPDLARSVPLFMRLRLSL